MKTIRMTAGRYYITDCCQTHEDYYQGFLLSDGWRDPLGQKLGSCYVRATGADGCWAVPDMDNEVVGFSGSDAGNVSVVPQKLTGPVADHYGTPIEIDHDFDIVCYHDAIVIDGRLRVRNLGGF